MPDEWVGPSLDYRLGGALNVSRLSRSRRHLGTSRPLDVSSRVLATDVGTCSVIKAVVVEVPRRRDLLKPDGGSADVPGEGSHERLPLVHPRFRHNRVAHPPRSSPRGYLRAYRPHLGSQGARANPCTPANCPGPTSRIPSHHRHWLRRWLSHRRQSRNFRGRRHAHQQTLAGTSIGKETHVPRRVGRS